MKRRLAPSLRTIRAGTRLTVYRAHRRSFRFCKYGVWENSVARERATSRFSSWRFIFEFCSLDRRFSMFLRFDDSDRDCEASLRLTERMSESQRAESGSGSESEKFRRGQDWPLDMYASKKEIENICEIATHSMTRKAFLLWRVIWVTGKSCFSGEQIIWGFRTLQSGKSLVSHYRICKRVCLDLKNDYSFTLV